eukprot:983219-Pelagomonas_calceolata.AAC.1
MPPAALPHQLRVLASYLLQLSLVVCRDSGCLVLLPLEHFTVGFDLLCIPQKLFDAGLLQLVRVAEPEGSLQLFQLQRQFLFPFLQLFQLLAAFPRDQSTGCNPSPEPKESKHVQLQQCLASVVQ